MQRISRQLFATGMIGLGILGLVYGDFALQWQPVPVSIPGRADFAYACAVLMLLSGIGLLWRRSAGYSTVVLLAYLLLWLLWLKVPRVVMRPRVEGNWLGFGEIAVLTAGAWALFGSLGPGWTSTRLNAVAGRNGVRIARYLFGAALIPVGLSHFVYASETASLVPAWLPYRLDWAYLAGAGHLAAGVGVILGVYLRLAATLEAAMLTVFTVLVWIPAVVAAPTTRLPWTALLISWAISTGAWVVAGALAEKGAVTRSARIPA
jgi:uncharacterized membrane protein